MSKIISLMLIFLAAAVFLTCDRNEIYKKSGLNPLFLAGGTAAAPTAICLFNAGIYIRIY
jgi:hypothetical protein